MITLNQHPDDRIKDLILYKKDLINKLIDCSSNIPQYQVLLEQIGVTDDQIYILLGVNDVGGDDDKDKPEDIPVFPDPQNGAI
jgi:hypothetical protein